MRTPSCKLDRTNQLLDEAGLPRSFCVLPWTHIMAKHTGQIKPCCLWQASESDGFPKAMPGDLDIDEAINCDEYKRLRQRFLDGERPDACSRCWQAEENGIDSMRISRVEMYAADELTRLARNTHNGYLHDFKMHWFDFRLSNICNLKCRMCFPSESSRIAQEFEELGWYAPRVADPVRMQAWFDVFADRIDDARLIYFAGGEPLMMETHWRILDRLIMQGNTDLALTYSTNLTQMTYKGRSIFDIWQRFTDIYLSLSIDQIGSKAGYVRHGTDWDAWLENWYELRARCPHVKWRVATTVTVLNVMDLPEMIDYLCGKGVLHAGNEIELFTADSPSYLNVQCLPLDIKKRTTERLLAWCQNPPANVPLDAVPGMRAIVTWMNAHDAFDEQRKHFVNIMLKQDHKRGESLISLYPELHAIYVDGTDAR